MLGAGGIQGNRGRKGKRGARGQTKFFCCTVALWHPGDKIFITGGVWLMLLGGLAREAGE